MWHIMNVTLPVITIAAIIDSINPCAFSVLLLTIAFLFNLNKDRRRILEIGGLYIFAIFITYILIGVGVLQAMSFFGIPRFMTKLGAVLVIAFGAVSLIEKYCPSFPIKTKIPEFIKPTMAKVMQKGTAPAMFAVGVIVGLFEFPCTGGPYLMVLGLLHDKATFMQGFFYLIFYNFIFVLPLIIILFIASNQTLLAKVKEWKKQTGGNFNFYSSFAMIILGLVIFFL